MAGRTLLLTGATGFVGGALRPALERAGWQVRCLTRNAAGARGRAPELDWVEGDVADPASCARALDGCGAAVYLVHGIGEGPDYHERERAAASTFAQAAAQAGVVGLTEDLLAADDRFWHLTDHLNRLPFADAARRALDAERSRRRVPGAWGAVERARRLTESAA
jgi:uncharacterized protein YbjT (DUF2867 family)